HNSNLDDVYGAADTLISRDNPVLHVANFSSRPVVVSIGDILGKAHNPHSWLDKPRKFSSVDQRRIELHANLIRKLSSMQLKQGVSTVRSESVITSKAHNNAFGGVNDSSATDPIEGGPKTAEVGLEEVSSGQLIQEVDISPDLSPTQREKIEEVILRNCNAFRLDGRLGNHDAKVDIQLKPGSVPVSLPPYPVSLANREVI
ncbi:hypothetical protein K435DRAFT_590439, partial [Dendrothele bispora CBS 962.96]